MLNVVTTGTIWGCWALFAVVWLIGAVHNRRAGVTTLRRTSRHRAVPIAVLLACWVGTEWLPAGWWRPVTVHAGSVRIVGLVLLALGTVFTLWARGALGTMWAGAVRVTTEHELRTSGPYAVTRHPIYTGLLAMLTGSVLATGVGNGLVLMGVAAVWLVFKLRDEERMLTDTFGADYQRYRSRVPQLVPGVKGVRHR